MMVVILTIEQKDLINGFEVDGNLVMPITNNNDYYFITQAQAEMIEPFFAWVKELPSTEYVPPIAELI
jgi:hypothetical protein